VSKAEAWALLRLAAPLTGLALVNMAMSVTDTLMTAAFGVEALATVAVASDFYSILFYLAVGCIGGIGPLYAAAHSTGDADRLARLRAAGLTNTEVLTFATSVHAPLSPEVRRAMTDILEMRWPDVERELSREDLEQYRRLADPASPDFVLNLPDYYGFFTYSVFRGWVPRTAGTK